MDALRRLESVARPLLRQVDEALATLGAPVEHPVWSYLRTVGATPADAVAFFADLAVDPSLPRAGAALREQADRYVAADLPTTITWHGGAGEAYTTRVTALAAHLRGGDSMAGRLATTASYVDEIVAWQQRSRDRIAGALAEVLTSTQAVSVRVGAGVGTATVLAAADIGAWVLEAAAAALDDGRDLRARWEPGLAELPYRPPVEAGPDRFDATIHIGS